MCACPWLQPLTVGSLRQSRGDSPFAGDRHEPQEGAVVVSAYSGGAVYSRFDMVLPAGGQVTRDDAGAVLITTPRLRLALRVDYMGFASGLPRHFAEWYMKAKRMSVDPRQVVIGLDVSIRPLGLLFRDWSYYEWVDSFLEAFEADTSFDAFLRGIQWPTVGAILTSERLPPKG